MFTRRRHLTTLGVALCVHGVVVAVTMFLVPIRVSPVVAAIAVEATEVALDDSIAATSLEESEPSSSPATHAEPAVAQARAARVPWRGVENGKPTDVVAPTTIGAEPAPSEPWSVWSGIVRPNPPGGGSRFEIGRVPPAGSISPPARTAVDGVRAALDEHDRQLGLGADGPLISAIQSTTLSSRVPIESSAVVSATIDGDGNVVSVRATSGAGDASAWQEVAASVLQAMRGKKVRVPHGARGLRLSLRVESRRRQVAGHAASGQRSPLLVTHDNPDATRAPSVAFGTPVYRCQEACTASGNIDPTDGTLLATTNATRTVSVQSLGQERIQ